MSGQAFIGWHANSKDSVFWVTAEGVKGHQDSMWVGHTQAHLGFPSTGKQAWPMTPTLVQGPHLTSGAQNVSAMAHLASL